MAGRIRTNRRAGQAALESPACATCGRRGCGDSPVLDRDGAATYLGVSTETLDRLIMNGYLPAAKIGRAVRVRRTALDEYWAVQEKRMRRMA